MNTELNARLKNIRDSILSTEKTANHKLNDLFDAQFSAHAAVSIAYEKYPLFDSFYKENIHKFSIKLYDDQQVRPLEREFEVMVKKSQFLLMFKTLDDIVGYSLHLFLHRFMSDFWKRISVPKQIFSQTEIDFLEDIFIQSIVHQVSPRFVSIYVNQISELYKYLGITNIEKIAPALSLMRSGEEIEFLPIKAVHDWLYSLEERLNIETFQRYFYIFSKLKQTEPFQKYINPMKEAELIS